MRFVLVKDEDTLTAVNLDQIVFAKYMDGENLFLKTVLDQELNFTGVNAGVVWEAIKGQSVTVPL